MSVSDPLLKSLKSHVYSLCTSEGPITDDHGSLQPFCQLLEVILRKGMRHNSSSVFELGHLPRDYWQWVESLTASVNDRGRRVRKLPLFDVVVQRCLAAQKVTSVQGRGRLFLREALQRRLLVNALDLLSDNPDIMLSFYDPRLSILADEILHEILKSLLMQINELTFSLCLRNHSFLGDTWKLPIFKELELVPCRHLGVRLLHVGGRVIVTSLMKGSVSEDCNNIEVGDVLDELFEKSMRNVVRGTIPSLLKRFYGQPVSLCVVKARNSDGSVFPPINELLKSAKMSIDWLENPPEHESQSQQSRRPPHARLPDEVDDELPVHGANERASYNVQYIGQLSVGQDGGIGQIDPAIAELVDDSSCEMVMEVVLELSETQIIVRKQHSDDVIMRVCYTEVSSCGRRVDFADYFAYISGETTCSLAKAFTAHVFKATSENEAKTIICAIAQGFSRTHWFV